LVWATRSTLITDQSEKTTNRDSIPRTGDLNQELNLFQELKLFLLNLSCSGNAICVGRFNDEKTGYKIPISNSSIFAIKLLGDDFTLHKSYFTRSRVPPNRQTTPTVFDNLPN